LCLRWRRGDVGPSAHRHRRVDLLDLDVDRLPDEQFAASRKVGLGGRSHLPAFPGRAHLLLRAPFGPDAAPHYSMMMLARPHCGKTCGYGPQDRPAPPGGGGAFQVLAECAPLFRSRVPDDGTRSDVEGGAVVAEARDDGFLPGADG